MKKLTLNELKVTSFVTELPAENKLTVVAGNNKSDGDLGCDGLGTYYLALKSSAPCAMAVSAFVGTVLLTDYVTKHYCDQKK